MPYFRFNCRREIVAFEYFSAGGAEFGGSRGKGATGLQFLSAHVVSLQFAVVRNDEYCCFHLRVLANFNSVGCCFHLKVIARDRERGWMSVVVFI